MVYDGTELCEYVTDDLQPIVDDINKQKMQRELVNMASYIVNSIYEVEEDWVSTNSVKPFVKFYTYWTTLNYKTRIYYSLRKKSLVLIIGVIK